MLFKKIILFVFILTNSLFASDIIETLENINSIYCDNSKEGLKEFTADVDIDVINQMKEYVNKSLPPTDKRVKIINDLKINIKFDSNKAHEFNVSDIDTSGNVQYDNGLRQALSGLENMVIGFFEMWYELSMKPMFEDFSYTYEITAKNDSLNIDYIQDSSQVKLIFDKNNLLLESKVINDKSVMTEHPKYFKTDNGLTLKSFSVNVNNLINMIFDIEYIEISEIFLPSKIAFKQSSFGQEANGVITLKNHNLIKNK